MRRKIISLLSSIEEDENVRIIYACESGSRAWGFASTDSDYDVRFIYLHPPEFYLSIDVEKKRDVIELPIDSSLDISGWDLRKALQLLKRSNPPLIEWLGSPMIYKEEPVVISRMRVLAATCHSTSSCQYHYFKTASNNYAGAVQGDQVRLKKFFYVLRPLLALIWLERDFGIVPTEFAKLVDRVVDSKEVKKAIFDLLAVKKAAGERDLGPRMPLIIEFIDHEMARMEAEEFKLQRGSCSSNELNDFFRYTLNHLWSDNNHG